MLTPVHIIFYVFATIAVLSAVAVVTARHPMRSVLSLVITFFAAAGMWMILHAEFLSLILLLVYVGAVMTLFLFVVMMLSTEREASKKGFIRLMPFAVLLVVLVVGLVIAGLGVTKFGLTQMPLPPEKAANYDNLAQLGTVLYTSYVFDFELAGVILLTAIIGAITLTHRGPQRRKVQKVDKQLDIKREERIRLIKMPSEKKNKGQS